MRIRLFDRRFSQCQIRNLGPFAREMLGSVRKKEKTQLQFQNSNWSMWKGVEHNSHLAPGASGAREDGNPRATFLRGLLTYVNPCPTFADWFYGF